MFYSLYSFFTKQINVQCYNVVGEKTMAASQDEIKVWNKKAPVSNYVFMDLNPMISGCFIKTFFNLNGEELIKSLEEYLKDNEL